MLCIQSPELRDDYDNLLTASLNHLPNILSIPPPVSLVVINLSDLTEHQWSADHWLATPALAPGNYHSALLFLMFILKSIPSCLFHLKKIANQIYPLPITRSHLPKIS